MFTVDVKQQINNQQCFVSFLFPFPLTYICSAAYLHKFLWQSNARTCTYTNSIWPSLAHSLPTLIQSDFPYVRALAYNSLYPQAQNLILTKSIWPPMLRLEPIHLLPLAFPCTDTYLYQLAFHLSNTCLSLA